MFTVADLRMALEGLPDDRPVRTDLRFIDTEHGVRPVVDLLGGAWYYDPDSGPVGPIFLLSPQPFIVEREGRTL